MYVGPTEFACICGVCAIYYASFFLIQCESVTDGNELCFNLTTVNYGHWWRGFQGFRHGFQQFRPKLRWGFVRGFCQGFISAMLGYSGSGETDATSSAVGSSGMASVTLDVSGLEPSNPKGEAYNLSQRWKRWKHHVPSKQLLFTW